MAVGLTERRTLALGRTDAIYVVDSFEAGAHIGLVELIVGTHTLAIPIDGGAERRGISHFTQFSETQAIPLIVSSAALTLLSPALRVGQARARFSCFRAGITNWKARRLLSSLFNLN